jgi:hypothetical protein
MPRTVKPESSTVHTGDSSFVSLLSGWVQQGVENFFATQRILVDLAMTQNANAMKMIRSRFADPAFCPAAIASELAGEVMNNFIEGQKLLLGLAQREHEIVTTGVRERVAGNSAAVAMTDLVQRGFDTFVEMQQDFLKMATKQTNTWLNAVKTGKGFDPEGMVEVAREAMETFVHTQKKFLDTIAEQTMKATSTREPGRKVKQTELTELAKEATDAFIEAQKKLIDVAGKQANAGMRAAGKTLNMITPFPFIPIPDLTREGVKSFVTAEKALIDTVMHRPEPKRTPRTTARKRGRRAGRTIKMETATA